MSDVNKQMVSLIVHACLATRKNREHEAHIFHVLRSAVDSNGPAACQFYTYFWCAGWRTPAESIADEVSS